MNIFVSAGDLSGEIHLAGLVKELKKIDGSISISALGGSRLKEVSNDFLADIVNINAFGFLPIKQILYLKKVYAQVKTLFLRQKPDKVILTDYYGFNIRLARLAKSLNIPVYYFISPQVWASRSGRIAKLKDCVKKMLLIFPFEEKLYRARGVDAVFVGHPLLDKIEQKTNLDISKPPAIGLFPGSRKDAIERHLPVIIKTAEILKEKIPARFMMFNSNATLKTRLPSFIELKSPDDMDARKSIDIAVCPSGTVSLENALYGIPMAVMYKLSLINYLIIRTLIKVKHITIANILMDKPIVKEFIQFDAKPQKIAEHVLELLHPEIYARKVGELIEVRKVLGEGGALKRTAQIIVKEML
jgi:lipid-A-disaccharide synthase